MTHVDPTTRRPWWRAVLDLEPVAAQALVRVIFVFVGSALALASVTLPEALEPSILALVGAFYLVVETFTTVFARRKVTPDAKVLEAVQRDDDGVFVVVAGDAADQVHPGAVVREYGALPDGDDSLIG